MRPYGEQLDGHRYRLNDNGHRERAETVRCRRRARRAGEAEAGAQLDEAALPAPENDAELNYDFEEDRYFAQCAESSEETIGILAAWLLSLERDE